MANVENVEEMVGTREVEVAGVAIESGGAVATESGGVVATEFGEAATTGDATAGDNTAATGGVMYADEGPYTIDVCHVEEMVGTTREAADGDRIRRDETATRSETRPATRRRRRLVMNETAATGGLMYMDKGELEFDEDEMAALEG